LGYDLVINQRKEAHKMTIFYTIPTYSGFAAVCKQGEQYAIACALPYGLTELLDVLEAQESSGGFLTGPTEFQKLIAFIEGPVVN
jgi:hypothetical protein